jgi:hypothetical protein
MQLKEWIGYFAHGVFAYDEKQESKTDRIVGFFRDHLDFENWSPENTQMHNYKLVLRPLSDLTKPCLDDMKVPMIELAKMFDMNVVEYCFIEQNPTLIESTSRYPVVQQLYKWHFDIHSQIEKGYAIDINSINV